MVQFITLPSYSIKNVTRSVWDVIWHFINLKPQCKHCILYISLHLGHSCKVKSTGNLSTSGDTVYACLQVIAYVCAKSKCSHHIRPNHLSMMQGEKIHNLFTLSSVMMATEWSGHMCGSALYESLMATEPGRGGLSMKTDGQEKKEGAIKLRKLCWVSPYGRMNYRRLAVLNVRMQHIIPDWSFLYWLDWIKYTVSAQA